MKENKGEAMQRNMGRQMRLAVSLGLLTLALVAPGVGRAAAPANTSDGGAVVGRAALHKKSYPAPPQTTTAAQPRTNAISLQAVATYFVTTTMDDAVGVPANCPAGVSNTTNCSLRDAIAAATSGGDTIQFAGGGIGTTTLANGSLLLDNAVTITGPTSGGTVTVDGGAVGGSGGVPVFVIGASAPAFSVSNLTIQNGNNTGAGASQGGGAIDDTNGGNLTVLNVTFTGNTATNNNGGAIFVGGRVTPTISVTRSAFTNNSAGAGGGMEIATGNATFADVTFTNNVANGVGGGFYTLTNGTVALTNVIFTGNNGGDTGTGGGMEADNGTVTITNSAFINNIIPSGSANAGGLEVSRSAVTVTNTLFSGNQAIGSGSGNFGEGGGIEVDSGTLIVTGSTFVGNQAVNSDRMASSDGGGIDIFSGKVTVVNSTFSGNQATNINSFGGTIGVFENRSVGNPPTPVESTVTLLNTTIVGSAAETGAGIDVSATSTTGMPVTPVVTLTNTIVAGSTNVATPPAPAVDIVGAFSATSKNNLIGSADTTSTGIVNGTNNNKVGTVGAPINPLLAPLADYSAGTPAPTLPDGSHLKTLALLAGSPAFGAGDPATCANPLPAPPPATGPFGAGGVDQRDVARPGIAGTNCDIGAFESRGFTLAATGGGNQSANVSTAFAAPLAVVITPNDAGVPTNGIPVTFTAPASGPSATLSNGTVATNGTGAASVTATANTTPGRYSVTANVTSAGVSPAAVTFALQNIGPPAQLIFTTEPSASAVAGAPFSVAVTVKDVNGVTIANFTGSVSLSLSGGTSGATLGGTTTVNAVNGVATFTNLTVNKAGSGYMLIPATGSVTGAPSTPFTITAPAAPTLKSIAFTGPNGTPLPTTLKVGQMVQITAIGTFSDGSTQNVTGQVQWSTSNAQIVKVDAGGTVTGESPGGPVTITATLNGVPQTVMFTVGAPTPIGITVQPAPASRPSGVGITSPGALAPAAAPVGR